MTNLNFRASIRRSDKFHVQRCERADTVIIVRFLNQVTFCIYHVTSYDSSSPLRCLFINFCTVAVCLSISGGDLQLGGLRFPAGSGTA